MSENINIPRTPSYTPPPEEQTTIPRTLQEEEENETLDDSEEELNIQQPQTQIVEQEIPKTTAIVTKSKKKTAFKPTGIYTRSSINRTLTLPIVSVGKNILTVIEKNIKQLYEGKCIVEGYVKKDSIKVITHSSGLLKGDTVVFNVVFECEICFPVEGMLISCVAKDIGLGGIRAESATEKPSPIVVYIARDHNYKNDYFSEIKEGEKFTASVIGQRFELNDTYVSIIAKIVKPKTDYYKKTAIKQKSTLVIEED